MHAFTKATQTASNMVKNDMVSSGVSNAPMVNEENSLKTSSNSLAESSESRDSSKASCENEEKSLEIDVSAEMEPTSDEKQEQDTENETPNRKRPASEGEIIPIKKSRNKPKPQIIEDMKEYYQKDSLSKLSTATLRHWLKDHLIHCTTRDKKDVLVEKVKGYFLDNNM
ncbi:uncharacterized protein LOC112904197 [Agrilus planipennis]|uniref:Uncharacterized protein LOC112904197 n=1 Tax=Agrilus planipennis TaxID=224129 RepID=A0A7F5R2T7_AGRPL|nr:uncharacterized protein LOC112904197 [Agrilus planipennis]